MAAVGRMTTLSTLNRVICIVMVSMNINKFRVFMTYDSDEHQEDILESDDAFECASSEGVAASGCGKTSSEGSVAAMGTLSNDVVDGFDEVSARHAVCFIAFSMLSAVCF